MLAYHRGYGCQRRDLRLREPGKPCLVVSSYMIEDVHFFGVYRASTVYYWALIVACSLQVFMSPCHQKGPCIGVARIGVARGAYKYNERHL